MSFDYLFSKNSPGEELKETTNNRNTKIRTFYTSCWSVDSAKLEEDLPVGSQFSGGTMTLSPRVVDRFFACLSRSKGDHLVSRSPTPWLPLDFGILVAWPALIKPLLLSDIAGDIFRLLHRSNSFELCPGVEPFRIGDVLKTSSCISKILIQPHGKLVEVVATIHRERRALMKVTSAFFIQGKPSDDENPESVDEMEMTLTINSTKLLALILSRSCFKFRKTGQPIIGKSLLFKIRSKKTRTSSLGVSALKVSGQIYTETDDGSSQIQVGVVHFVNPSCAGNPVTDFLERYGSPLQTLEPLASPGWKPTKPRLIRVPDSGREYSDVSTDGNPIHVCPIFAGFALLPGPITHGMYTSAIVRMAIEAEITQSDVFRFRRWSTSFDGMVRAGDILRIELHHVAMIEGRMVFDVKVYNHESNDKVLQATAEVEQDRTAYIFCGQGSQVKNMGMALYESDDVARALWDKGNQYLLETFGFSLLDLVRKDPKELTVYFGGPKGRKIRENYLTMTRKVHQGGKMIVLPVIEGLTPESESHTFRDARGLLFSTQFAQPVITLMNLAEMASLKSRGLVQENALFAGHSLGEYSALAACTSCFIQLDDLLRAVFYRGLVMQVAMTRDSDGRTDFSMVAVNPSRVGKSFKEKSLKILVQYITSSTGLLLEVVNFNVERQQYVCAGHLQALWILGQACDMLASNPEFSMCSSKDTETIVRQLIPMAKVASHPIELDRGRATVPLSGIDIPFHSSYLRAGIDVFRECLVQMISEEAVVPEQLIGKFIPNVMGTPFSLDRKYVEEAARVTGSKMLKSLLGQGA
ncbi:malonyl Co-A carrier protein [Hyphodiscus hymeniophilus]|uniref:Malonyl Co-A carrier protein n=1 Tax=Hyphodiscus hymeniophilus TaxID=353542 RepID=A0A9P6VD28_9HELO|nr:malonyl Co-A carrier protein [Hyphodiscus hymeniophilus]